METFGKLQVRIYICYSQDEHGRTTSGSWRTLMTRWTDRENVEQLLQTFSAANPELQPHRHQLRVTFDTSEAIRIT
jgi:hypothetical protein